MLIHRYSSILSAYGLALADRVYEEQEPCAATYSAASASEFSSRLDEIGSRVKAELSKQGFADDQIQLERMLHMRFNGSDTALMM